MRRYLWPRACVWEMTLGCNLQCLHCGSTAGPKTARPDELTTEQAHDFCEQAVGIGLEQITLSGGEPLLRPDWADLARFLAGNGVKVCIITNGLSIDDRIRGQLEALARDGYPLTVGISIDGLAPCHERIRGRPGLFNRAVREMKLLKEMGHHVNVLTTVHRQNLEDLPALRAEIYGWQPDAWQVQIANAYGRMCEHDDWLLDLEQYVWLVDFLAETKKKSTTVRIDPADCIGYHGPTEEILRPTGQWRGCHAGTRGFGLRSNGDVLGCLSLMGDPWVEGNLRERSLYDIWHDPNAFAYNRQFEVADLGPECRQCEHGEHCAGGCLAVAHSINGQFHHPPYCVTRYDILQKKKEAAALPRVG